MKNFLHQIDFFNTCTLVDRGDNFAKIDCCWLDGPVKTAQTIRASRNSVSWKHVSDQGHCWAVVRAEKLRSKVNLILTQSKFKMSGVDLLARLHTQLEIEYWRLVSGRAIIKNFLLIKSMQIKVSCHCCPPNTPTTGYCCHDQLVVVWFGFELVQAVSFLPWDSPALLISFPDFGPWRQLKGWYALGEWENCKW